MTLPSRHTILACILAVAPPLLRGQTGTISSISDLQNRSTTVAPGDPVVMLGTNLVRPTPGVTQPPVIAVTIGGKPTALRTFSATNVEFVIPYDVPTGTQPVVITQNGTPNASGSITVARLAPNLLTDDWSRDGAGLIVRSFNTPNMREDGSYLLEYPSLSATNPAIPGEQVYVMATGLGVTNPASPSLAFPAASVPVAAKVELTLNGRPIEGVRARMEPEQQVIFFRLVKRYTSILGWARIYFTVPPDTPEGSHQLRISADGVPGNTVRILVGKRRPVISSVNTATNRHFGLAPGALQSIYGVNFGGTTATGGFTSLKAGEVFVELDGRPVAILGVFEPQGQVNFVTPMDLPANRRIYITLKTPHGNVNHPIFSSPVLPSMFNLPDPADAKRKFAIATLANTAWLTLPAAVAGALQFPVDCVAKGISPQSSCATPAKPGDILQFYMTGLGLASPDGTSTGSVIANGAIAPADGSVLHRVVAPVTVTVGGLGAEVVFAGVAPGYAGLYQLNVRVPASARPGDAVPVEVSMRIGTQNILDNALIAIAAQ